MTSRMLPTPRTARYSGSDRPAWRMNHTGTRDAGCRRQARRNGSSSWTGIGTTLRPGSELRQTAQPARLAARPGQYTARPPADRDGGRSEEEYVASHPELQAEQAYIDRAYD